MDNMGKDRTPSYSRRDDRSEYRSMTRSRSPTPKEKSSKSSRRKYSRSSSSSSSNSSASDDHSRSRHKGKKRSSSPILVPSSPERRLNARWLDSSPNFRPMTPPPPPTGKVVEAAPSAPPAPPMESRPIPSLPSQREDNFRSSSSHALSRNYPSGFNRQFEGGYFQGSNSPNFHPDGSSQHPFKSNEQQLSSNMGLGPPMLGGGPPHMMNRAGPPLDMMNPGPPQNIMNPGPPQNMMNTGPPQNMIDMGPMPNMAAPWEVPQGNYPFSADYNTPNEGPLQPSFTGFNQPSDHSHPAAPSSSSVVDKPNAVEQELVQQKRTLAIQREEYFKKKISLSRDLKVLKDKKRSLQHDDSKGSERLMKENLKLQDEIEEKLKSLDSVIEMLTHIIGDKEEIDQLLKETSRRSESPVKRKRSRSRSSSRSRSVKKRSPSPDRRSSSLSKNLPSSHVNIVHYDPELHWCSVCNVFPRSASVYLVHLHSDQHQNAVKQKKDKEKTAEEFFPWRIHEKQEQAPPVYKNAPSRRVPIRGVPFLVPATAWYCSMCKMWLGDLEVANNHLRGEKHAAIYSEYVAQNPHWEVDWLRDRTRAYEKNSESRNRLEDTKDEKFSKKNKKDAVELSDVSKLEQRLMAMISANNAKLAKEGSSKHKSRGRSSSRSDASYSESSDDERREKRKKKKNKKKKKAARESSEKLNEQEDSKTSKFERKDEGSDTEKVKPKRRWDDEKGDSRKVSERDDRKISERGDGSGRSNKRDRTPERMPDRLQSRDRLMNSWRGRGRISSPRFNNRRLINQKPLWRPSPQQEKLAIGRHVFGLSASEYYGPEVPPKKDDNDK